MADHHHHHPSLVYTDQWPDYPELLYGHELAPNPGLRPFAPFRLYKTPVAPPYAKTRAEVEYAVEQQAWGERQLRLYATGPPLPAGGADAAELASNVVAIGVATRAWLWFASSAWAAWGRVLWSAEPLWLAGYQGIETMAAGVAHMVNAATARMREAYESLFVVVSVCALLLALVVTAEGLLRLVSCYMHPGHGLAQEPYYILVRDVKSWAVPQPPKCA